MYDSDCGFWTKDCNLGARPRVVNVSAQVLASHRNVCAAISLAYDARYFGHSGFTVCKQQLAAVSNDAVVLLICSGKISWSVNKRHYRDVECVKESDESGSLVRRIDVKRACQIHWLVCNDAYRPATHPCKPYEDILGEQLMHFKKVAIVDY